MTQRRNDRHSRSESVEHTIRMSAPPKPSSQGQRRSFAPRMPERPHGRRMAPQAPPPHEAPSPPPQMPQKKRRRGCGCLLWLLLIVLIPAGVFAGWWLFESYTAPTPIEDVPAQQRQAVAQQRAEKNIHLLLVGADHRGDEPSRTDTMIFTVIRPAENKIEMMALPRDSLVTIPDHGQDKLNAAYAYGGAALLENTVESLLGTHLDHIIAVDFASFAKVIDAMGGIVIDVPARMYLPEENIDLQPGKQRLNGKDALAFVRWRDDGQGDIGRIERQSMFMAAVSQKMRFLMPWQAARMIQVLSSEVDTDMSLVEMLGAAGGMVGMKPDALTYHQLQAEPTYINGISYVLLDRQNIQRTVNLMRYGIVLDASSSRSNAVSQPQNAAATEPTYQPSYNSGGSSYAAPSGGQVQQTAPATTHSGSAATAPAAPRQDQPSNANSTTAPASNNTTSVPVAEPVAGQGATQGS